MIPLTTTPETTTTNTTELSVIMEKDVNGSTENYSEKTMDLEVRLKRSIESSDLDEPKNDIGSSIDHKVRAIPGLPDPATIKDIVDLVTNIGEQVLPLIVSGNIISSTSQQLMDRWIQNNQNLRHIRSDLQLLPKHLEIPTFC